MTLEQLKEMRTLFEENNKTLQESIQTLKEEIDNNKIPIRDIALDIFTNLESYIQILDPGDINFISNEVYGNNDIIIIKIGQSIVVQIFKGLVPYSSTITKNYEQLVFTGTEVKKEDSEDTEIVFKIANLEYLKTRLDEATDGDVVTFIENKETFLEEIAKFIEAVIKKKNEVLGIENNKKLDFLERELKVLPEEEPVDPEPTE